MSWFSKRGLCHSAQRSQIHSIGIHLSVQSAKIKVSRLHNNLVLFTSTGKELTVCDNCKGCLETDGSAQSEGKLSHIFAR